ncbi:MAG TPA: hypothetical protein VFZ08_00040 [Terriglobia bacterium]|nr:hypothetical protein [Terriglobia bacterium]
MLGRLSRVVLGCCLIAGILYAADFAVRDCPAGLYVSNNCLWLWVRGQTGLPESHFLHALVLWIVGLILLAGIYLTVRFIFPHRRARARVGATGAKREFVDEP